MGGFFVLDGHTICVGLEGFPHTHGLESPSLTFTGTGDNKIATQQATKAQEKATKRFQNITLNPVRTRIPRAVAIRKRKRTRNLAKLSFCPPDHGLPLPEGFYGRRDTV